MQKYYVVNKQHFNSLKNALQKAGFGFNVTTPIHKYPCYLIVDDNKRVSFVDETAFLQADADEYYLAQKDLLALKDCPYVGYVFLAKAGGELVHFDTLGVESRSYLSVHATPANAYRLNKVFGVQSFAMTPQAMADYHDLLLAVANFT